MKKVVLFAVLVAFCLMFVGCGEKVELIYQVLENGTDCEILGASDNTIKKLVIPDTIDGYTVTKIGWSAFAGYTELTSVELPSTLEVIETAFSNCTSLKKIEFPEGIKKIYGFNNCTSLTSIEIPKSAEDVGAFRGCTELKTIKVAEGNEKYTSRDKYGNECNVLIWESGSVVGKSIVIAGENPVIPDDIDSIASYAFSSNKEMTSIYIPSGVMGISADAFEGCLQLTTIYGTAGSAAEAFAVRYGYTFIEH